MDTSVTNYLWVVQNEKRNNVEVEFPLSWRGMHSCWKVYIVVLVTMICNVRSLIHFLVITFSLETTIFYWGRANKVSLEFPWPYLFGVNFVIWSDH